MKFTTPWRLIPLMMMDYRQSPIFICRPNYHRYSRPLLQYLYVPGIFKCMIM